jgi:hypothetical protein
MSQVMDIKCKTLHISAPASFQVGLIWTSIWPWSLVPYCQVTVGWYQLMQWK